MSSARFPNGGFSAAGGTSLPPAFLRTARARLALRAALGALLVSACGLAAAQAAESRRAPAAPPGTAVLSIEQVERAWPRLTAEQQFIAVEQLLRGGRFDVAERLLTSTKYGANARPTQQFYLAIVRRAQGKPAQAIDMFRAILADHPDYSRVRLELAATLFQVQEDESARHNFELVLGASGSQPGLANTVRSYINAIDSRRRWDFSTYLTIAPSTNLNQGSDNRVVYLNGLPFVISDANQKQSGVGIVTGFQGSYRQPVSDKLDLVLSGGAHTKRYPDSNFNDLLASVSFGPRYRFDQGYLGLYAIADKRWFADTDYSTSFGGLLSGAFRLAPSDIVFADLGCSERRFEDDWKGSDLTYQDGHACFASARFEHHIDAATYVQALGGGGEETAGLAHLDNESWNAGAGIYSELPWGLSLYLQGLYTRREYDGIFPGIAEARRDDRVDVSLNATKRDLDIFGFAPMAQFTYTHNVSNVSFYVYDAQGLNLTLTKKF
jgi:tetratricopeptide (TPR) repeat protein